MLKYRRSIRCLKNMQCGKFETKVCFVGNRSASDITRLVGIPGRFPVEIFVVFVIPKLFYRKLLFLYEKSTHEPD
jgi:hypothetical protein